MYNKIKKKHFMIIINMIIVSLFILGAFGPLASIPEKPHQEIQVQTSTVDSYNPTSPHQKSIIKRTDMVDPTEMYANEPAPMGLADFGVQNAGTSEQAYSYNTTSFQGFAHINYLRVTNNSTNSLSMSFQFNLNLAFYNGNTLYVYWVQDVAYVDTGTNKIQFIDNIWNMSSPTADMHHSTLTGNGAIGNSSGTHFYYDLASQNLPGNCINLPDPYNVNFMVNSTITSNGQPEVDFMYNDGHGWITYDQPIFTFVNHLTKDCGFVVDGYNYEPDGYSFYDAELILGGPGGGSSTIDMSSSITLNIQYWNGHNYQEIRSAYNYGTNTAETIGNVVSGAYYDINNGTLFEKISPGSGKLEQVYSSSDISTLNISTPLSSGTLYINGTPQKFVNHEINLTIAPGDYGIAIYNESQLFTKFNVNLAPGEYKEIKTNESLVTFTETGLPVGIEWWVNLTGHHYHSYTNSISFYEHNGNYTYTITTSDHIYYPILSTGTLTTNGKAVLISTDFKKLTYKVIFTENGLKLGTSWNLSFNGETYTLTNSSYSFQLTNGTYTYSATSTDYRNISTQLNIEGKSTLVSLLFIFQKYNVTFEETGLASSEWYVNITEDNGTIYDSGAIKETLYTLELTNGTYKYTVATSNHIYSVSAYSNKLLINGKTLQISVIFEPVKYNLIVSENGLKWDATWTLIFDNWSYTLSNGSYVFQLTNGTYNYSGMSVYYKNVSGTVTINGAPQSLGILFTLQEYNVTFKELGLLNNTSWSVTLNGTKESSTISTIVFTESNGTYKYIVGNVSGYTVSPLSDSLTIDGSSISELIAFTRITYNVTFIESGLPNGTTWYVNLTNGMSSGAITGTSYSFSLSNASYTYTIATSDQIYKPSAYSGSVTVDGKSVSESVTFTKVTYTVTFIESGLASGTAWYVNITGHDSGPITGPTYTLSLSNASYTYTIATSDQIYKPSAYSGSLTVNGKSVPVSVTFTKVTYNVTFTELGLPSGTSWTLDCNGNTYSLTNTSYTFKLTNGTYSYFATSKDYKNLSGSVTVNGANKTVDLSFTLQTYNVTFTETGLASGTTWSITLNGTTESSTTSTILFSEINGTYTYSVANVSGYTVSPLSGSVTVQGKNAAQAITFTKIVTPPAKYSVTFTETGLPKGTPWYVNLTNGTGSGPITSSYTFHLANGTYTYITSHVQYYYSSNGTFTVDGPYHISVNYLKYPHLKLSVTPSSSSVSINGANVTLSSGVFSEYTVQGYYYITVDNSSYRPYSNMVYLSWNGTYTYNIALKQVKTYGYLTGTVLPGNATVTANGMGIPVMHGYFNVSLAPGTYYVTVTAPGYNGNISVEKITQNRATSLTVTLSEVIKTVTVSGYLSQANASLTVNGMAAYVNSTGYYDISVPEGNVTISAYESGYYPNSRVIDLTSSRMMNITLSKEPTPTSTETVNNTVTSGYNVKITNFTTNNGYISMNYNATINGTITVLLPFNEIRNATISDILNSKVYIDGLLYKNFSITVTSNGSAVLTVYNLAGDPSLYWKYSPDASLPSYYNITFTESGLPSGTSWSVTLNGTTESSTTSTIVFSEINGTYKYTVNSISGYTVSSSSGSITVNGKNATQSVSFTKIVTPPSKSKPFKLSAIEFYGIIGAVVAIAAIGGAAIVLRRRR